MSTILVDRRNFLCGSLTAVASLSAAAGSNPAILHPRDFRQHIDFFNRMGEEEVVQAVPDAQAWDWLQANIPFFTCPDQEIEQIYYYRWWVFRKHIKQTSKGLIVTEFLKPVKHAGEYNALSCAFGHHVAEGRWLKERRYIDEYTSFWLTGGPNGELHPNFHQFSGWAAAAAYARWLVNGDSAFLTSLLEPLVRDYQTWERDRLLPDGLFWQRDVSDGMEESVSGGRKVKNVRPSINSYMYGNAVALSRIARLAGKTDLAREYDAKAAGLKHLVQANLWNDDQQFFETRLESGQFAGVREEIGFTPWMFGLPDATDQYAAAWRQLMDPEGFYAPYGITTAERRHPGFHIAQEGDDCQWNGPAWPFATTITLKALARLLQEYPQQNAIRYEDYFRTFQIYTHSQHRTLANGQTISWIDENLDPLTGEWQARRMKVRKGTFYGRGDHYNHSGYADLLISGLIGLRPRPDNVVEVNPLLPADAWDWFCLDRVPYRRHMLSILWDSSGKKFQHGAGLRVFAGGKQIGYSARLARLVCPLPVTVSSRS